MAQRTLSDKEITETVEKVKKEKKTAHDRVNDYEGFYNRCFEEFDIDTEELKRESFDTEKKEMSLDKFQQAASARGVPSDYWKMMFAREGVKRPDALGKEMFERFFHNKNISVNKVGRFYVSKGATQPFKGKIYQPGWYLPWEFFTRRTNQ